MIRFLPFCLLSPLASILVSCEEKDPQSHQEQEEVQQLLGLAAKNAPQQPLAQPEPLTLTLDDLAKCKDSDPSDWPTWRFFVAFSDRVGGSEYNQTFGAFKEFTPALRDVCALSLYFVEFSGEGHLTAALYFENIDQNLELLNVVRSACKRYGDEVRAGVLDQVIAYMEANREVLEYVSWDRPDPDNDPLPDEAFDLEQFDDPFMSANYNIVSKVRDDIAANPNDYLHPSPGKKSEQDASPNP